MPRRNHTPPHQPYRPAIHRSPKKRFPNRAAAERAIAAIRMYHLDVSLRAYRSPYDGGWYLTSQTDQPDFPSSSHPKGRTRR